MNSPRPLPHEKPLSRLRVVAVYVLSLYAAAVLIASLSSSLPLGPLGPLQQAGRSLLSHLGLLAGAEVFGGDRGKWKRKSFCTVVIGSDEAGAAKRMYETYPGCQAPSFRAFEDTFSVLLVRTGHVPEIKNLVGASAKETAAELKRVRRSRSMSRVARYFCSSSVAHEAAELEQPPRFVDVLWMVEQVHYSTGATRSDVHHVHSFDCRKDKRVPSRLGRCDLRKDSTGSLSLGECRPPKKQKASSEAPE